MQLGGTDSVDLTTLKGLARYEANTLQNVNAKGFVDADIVALMNQKQRALQNFIITEAFNDWHENTVDGTGTGSINLVDGTNSYSFPTDLILLDRVEVNYSGNQNGYVVAQGRVLQEIDAGVNNTANGNAFVGTQSNPIYWVRDGEIYIDPVPIKSVSNGLKVYGVTQVTDLSGSTDEPVFQEAYHPLLALEAAFEYLTTRALDASHIVAKIKDLKAQMLKYYVRRNPARRKRITRKLRNYR